MNLGKNKCGGVLGNTNRGTDDLKSLVQVLYNQAFSGFGMEGIGVFVL